jgi:hypothetical protein
LLVKDLKKGMMIKPINKKYQFRATSMGWMNATTTLRKGKLSIREKECFAIYIGKKEDVGESVIAWSDKYVLFEGKILAVDPHAWRNIVPVEREDK